MSSTQPHDVSATPSSSRLRWRSSSKLTDKIDEIETSFNGEHRGSDVEIKPRASTAALAPTNFRDFTDSILTSRHHDAIDDSPSTDVQEAVQLDYIDSDHRRSGYSDHNARSRIPILSPEKLRARLLASKNDSDESTSSEIAFSSPEFINGRKRRRLDGPIDDIIDADEQSELQNAEGGGEETNLRDYDVEPSRSSLPSSPLAASTNPGLFRPSLHTYGTSTPVQAPAAAINEQQQHIPHVRPTFQSTELTPSASSGPLSVSTALSPLVNRKRQYPLTPEYTPNGAATKVRDWIMEIGTFAQQKSDDWEIVEVGSIALRDSKGDNCTFFSDDEGRKWCLLGDCLEDTSSAGLKVGDLIEVRVGYSIDESGEEVHIAALWNRVP